MKSNHEFNLPDADFKNATMLMGSLLSVSTLYAGKPSLDLARLAYTLAEQLGAPKYAESIFIRSLAEKLVLQWSFIVRELEITDAAFTEDYAELNG